MRGLAAKRSLPIVSHKSAIQREDSHMQKHESYNSITYQKSVILFGSVVVLSYTIKIYIFIFVHFTLCPSTMLELYQTESAAQTSTFSFISSLLYLNIDKTILFPITFLLISSSGPQKKNGGNAKICVSTILFIPPASGCGPSAFQWPGKDARPARRTADPPGSPQPRRRGNGRPRTAGKSP